MIEFKSNNFLHTQITSIFKNIFSSENLFASEINEVETDVKQILILHVYLFNLSSGMKLNANS